MLALVVVVAVLLEFVPSSLSMPNRNGWKAADDSSKEMIDEKRMELDGVMALLQSVAHQLASLRGVIHNLKVHNQMIYKHLHKMHQEKCQMTPKKDLTWTARMAATAYQNYEADTVAKEEAKSSLAVSCLSGFHQNRETGKCYRVYPENRVSWRVARDRCKSSGAELLSVQSSKEQSFVNELLRKKNAGKCDYWTGLTSTRRATVGHSYPHSGTAAAAGGGGRRTVGSHIHTIWYWSGDGTSLGRYSNWNDNEPNDIREGDGDGGDVCVQMLWIFNWKWNDASCTESIACFICQTPPPAPYKKAFFQRN